MSFWEKLFSCFSASKTKTRSAVYIARYQPLPKSVKRIVNSEEEIEEFDIDSALAKVTSLQTRISEVSSDQNNDIIKINRRTQRDYA